MAFNWIDRINGEDAILADDVNTLAAGIREAIGNAFDAYEEANNAKVSANAANTTAKAANATANEAIGYARRANSTSFHRTKFLLDSYITKNLKEVDERIIEPFVAEKDLMVVYSVDFEEYKGNITPDIFAWFGNNEQFGATIGCIANRIYSVMFLSAGAPFTEEMVDMKISYGIGDGAQVMSNNRNFFITEKSDIIEPNMVNAYNIPIGEVMVTSSLSTLELYWFDGTVARNISAEGGIAEIPDQSVTKEKIANGAVNWDKLESSVIVAINGIGARGEEAYQRTVELENGLYTILNALNAALGEEVTE